MVEVTSVPGVSCVDLFEASPSERCPHTLPKSPIETQRNIDSADCRSVSVPDALPWSFVTRDQAMQFCARSGKRLPTGEEWYALVLGSADTESACNVKTQERSLTGSYKSCIAPSGAYDLVGNVWEWVVDDVVMNTWNNRQLPENGYVQQVDASGVPLQTGEEGNLIFGNDYFWSPSTDASGMIRGGYYDSGSDAGIYTVHADTLTTAASAGIGFRCVL
jgi:formylglycine-generating enzyme required for sulfatase activity